MPPTRTFIALGALFALTATLFGAYAHHSLRPELLKIDRWEGVALALQYQWYHALALVGFGLWVSHFKVEGKHRFIGWLMVVGVALFSGMIYLRAINPAFEIAAKLTPLGGLCLMLAWGWWAWAAWQTPAVSKEI
ncbi:DUF423 domain-containing protein [Magnetococcus sp. PR-3]|uniref:DUF423 domain-containing protein n=1 Tax=Magnetococcus sp. PR-3 TaxID=3120355 RepID=UPI002FCE4C44